MKKPNYKHLRTLRTGLLAAALLSPLPAQTPPALKVTDAGVGIGTDAPTAGFEFYSPSGQLTASLSDSGSRAGFFALNANTANYGSGAALTFGNVQSRGNSSLGFAAIKGFLTNGDSRTTGDLIFTTRGSRNDTALTERLRIAAKGKVSIGPSFDGSAASNTFQTNAGSLPATLNSELSLASFGFRGSNEISLGLVAKRIGSVTPGWEWNSTAVGLGLDVDSISNVTGTRLWFNANGNVGVGTATPVSKLDVSGVLHLSGNLPNNSNVSTPTQGAYIAWNDSGGTGESSFINHKGGGFGGFTFSNTDGSTKVQLMYITHEGEVRAKKFLATGTNTPYADYVFAPDFDLPSLESVEAHIQEKRHLPGVPSEAEVKKDGIDLVQQTVAQLAQIEQLTLHVIAMNKQLQAQAEEIKQLKGALLQNRPQADQK